MLARLRAWLARRRDQSSAGETHTHVVAAIALRGKKSAMDAVIIVLAIGATIFSLVVLISVLWSIITKRSLNLTLP